MQSLSPASSDELADLMRQALGNGALAQEMAALTDNLRALRPDLPWGRGERVRGNGSLGSAKRPGRWRNRRAGRPRSISLARSTRARRWTTSMSRRSHGTWAGTPPTTCGGCRSWNESCAGRAGSPVPRTALTLSPKALRRLGQHRAARGLRRSGPPAGGDSTTCAKPAPRASVTGASRPWQFGDEQPLDVVRTVVPRGPASRVRGLPVELAVEDFEVVETERRASAAVALLRRPLVLHGARGSLGPDEADRAGAAHLIATRFPQDALQIIGFGLAASPLSQVGAGRRRSRTASRAPTCSTRCGWPGGTYAGTRAGAGGLVVTDGEPTAHLTRRTGTLFCWPPLRRRSRRRSPRSTS